jgi:hypothetical protein
MKFKCIQSGNTVEFFQDHEIAEMRKHTGYTEVIEVAETPKVTVTSSKKTVKQDETSIDG